MEYFEKVLQLNLCMRYCCATESTNRIAIDYGTVDTLHDIARCFQTMEMYADACKYLQCALNMFERLPPLNDPKYNIPKENQSVDVWVTFGSCLMCQGDYVNSKCYFEKAISFFQTYPKFAHIEAKRIVRKEIAKSLIRENSTDYAVKICEEIIQSLNHSSTLDYSHKIFSLDFYEIGRCLFDKLMYKEANKIFKAALDMLLKLSDDIETDTDIADIHQHMGDSFLALKKYDQAYEHFDVCARIRKRVTEDGVYEKAINNLDRSLSDEQKITAYQKKFNADFIADIWFKMGKCHVSIDEVDNAVVCFRNFWSEIEKLSINTSQRQIDIYKMLSFQSLRMQRYKKAKAYLNHLLESNNSKDNVSECDIVAVYGYIGFCCIKLDDFGGAKVWLKKTVHRIPKTSFSLHGLQQKDLVFEEVKRNRRVSW